jgi:hypothetical protein
VSDPSIDLIRARMARIRARAQNKAGRLGEESRQFLDWKHYIRIFPWSTLAAAAIVGYVMVPRRLPMSRPTGDALLDLARQNQEALKAIQQPTPQKRQPGILDMALNMAGSALWKAGLAFATQQVSRLVSQQMGTATDQPQPFSQPISRDVPRHDFV